MKSLYLSPNSADTPDFTSVIVHELRNPLTTIKLSAGMIAKITADEDIAKYLDIILKSIERIDDLVKELLVPPPPLFRNKDILETFSIHQLLDEVIQMLDNRLMLKEIEVRTAYDANDIIIPLVKGQLKIAFTNIIINAIDAMAVQEGKLKLATKSTDDKIIIQIEDNGCGIKPENLDNIFKPYFTDKPDGLGFGLAAAQRILNSNNIEIKVESQVGVGTCFTLLLDKNYVSEAC